MTPLTSRLLASLERARSRRHRAGRRARGRVLALGLMLVPVSITTVAMAAVPERGTYERSRTLVGERVSARLALEDGRAELSTGGRGLLVRCTRDQEILATIDPGDVIVRVREDGSFSRTRTIRFSTRATGRATARETYTGRVVGDRARLRFTTRITGQRASCRKTAEWSLRGRDA